MMKKILLVLDHGDSAQLAREYVLQLASRHQCAVTAVALIDSSPLLQGEAMPPGAYAYREARDASMEQRWQDNARELQTAAQQQAAALHVALSCYIAEDSSPEDELSRNAPLHDLLAASTDSHLGDAEREHDMRWLESYLLNPVRPMLLFSPDCRVSAAARCVLLAYDGSPCAARALQQFVFLGIAHDLPRKIIVNHRDPQEALRLANEAASYLASHGLAAEVVPLSVSGNHADLLMKQCEEQAAALLVMGAFGHNSWKERLFGSTTRTLLRHSPVPMLLFH